jgi:hypothetical protein
MFLGPMKKPELFGKISSHLLSFIEVKIEGSKIIRIPFKLSPCVY